MGHIGGHSSRIARAEGGRTKDFLWFTTNHLLRFLDNPALPLDNNPVEQMIRPVALGRKNWLFVGSEAGGHAAAVYMTLMATCKRAHVNPAVYFKDILGRIMDHPVSRLDELLPGIWKPINA